VKERLLPHIFYSILYHKFKIRNFAAVSDPSSPHELSKQWDRQNGESKTQPLCPTLGATPLHGVVWKLVAKRCPLENTSPGDGISAMASRSVGRGRRGKHQYPNCKSSLSSQVCSASCSSSSLKPEVLKEPQLPCSFCQVPSSQTPAQTELLSFLMCSLVTRSARPGSKQKLDGKRC